MKLVTPAEYARLSPQTQGYVTYMQAEHRGSRIPKKCPYPKGSKREEAWRAGEFAAVLEAQDSEN